MISKENVNDIYRLSPLQEGMYFHWMCDKSSAYFEQISYRLNGNLNISFIKSSLNELMKRHDILRTVFTNRSDKKLFQIVLKEREIYFYYEDITNKDDKNRYIREFIKKDKERSFDLNKDVLIRVSVLKLNKNEYEFIWSHHHILMDGWCTGILISEFLEIYRSYIEDRMFVLPRVKQYGEYIRWLDNKDKELSRRYWTRYLESYEEPAVIPCNGNDITKKNEESYKKDIVEIQLDENKSNAFRELAIKENVTLNIAFQVIWGILLGRYNNKNDVVFGAVVSGRPSEIEGIESMIGLFINTVPVRIKFGEGVRFNELLYKVQEKAIESESAHYYSLAEIQSESLLKQNLIDHILVFDNYPIAEQIDGVFDGNDENDKKEWFELVGIEVFEQDNYDFSVTVSPGELLRILFCFNQNKYSTEFVAKISKHFEQLLNQVLVDNELYIHALNHLTSREREQLLHEFNDTEVDYPKDHTIIELFAEQVKRTQDNTALAFEDQSLTYRVLNDKSNQLGRLLRESGVKENGIVGLMVERSFEMIIGIMGILKSGGAYLPIDSEYPMKRIKYMLIDSGAKILLTKKELSGRVDNEVAKIFLEDKEIYKNDGSNLELINRSSGLAYIIYTSGSTGNPKGILINHESFIDFITWAIKEYGHKKGYHVLLSNSYGFDGSVQQIFPTLVTGGVLYLIKQKTRLDMELYINYLKKHTINNIDEVPTLMNALFDTLITDKNTELLPDLTCLSLGSEHVPIELVRKCRKYLNNKGKIINGYGPAEASVETCTYLFDGWSQKERSLIGKPRQNLNVYILDRHNNCCPIGVPGEISVSGTGIARGYLNNPESTASVFIKSPYEYKHHEILYKTRDRGAWLPDGNIEFLGRIDSQVKIRGFRIELGEIESQLSHIDGIKEAVVIDRESERGDKYLCGYFVLDRSKSQTDRETESLNAADIKEKLSEKLPDYMIPPFLIQIENIPLTPNGKIDKRLLPEPTRTSYKATIAPRNEIEEKLLDLWLNVLNIKREMIGIDSNFFELGGHSLKATLLISQIHREFETKVPLSEIFKNSTIRGISVYIMNAKKEAYRSIEPIEKREYYELSSAQKRMYFLQQFDLDSTNYNIPNVLEFKGKINREKLYEILRKLILRHESFRTSFEIVQGEPIQRIYDDIEFKMRSYKAKGENQGKIKERVEEIIKRFIRPFDLKEAPLLQIGIIELENEEILMFDIHHIISDGISSQLLEEEFISLYEGNSLPDFRLQYKDYSVWQNSKGQRELIKEQEKYWVNQLSGELPVLNLPMDYPRPSIQSIEGALVEFELDRRESEGIYKIVRNNDATLYMVMLSIFTILLSRLGGQEDIIIGSPIAARRHTDLKNIIGMFINTLAMRNHPNGEKRYNEFLQEVKLKTLESYENQEYQFEDLVDKLSISRDTSRHPIFDVMFDLQNIDFSEGELSDVNIRPYKFEKRVSEFDIGLSCIENKGRIYFSLEYSTSLFKRETIERYIKYFRRIISSIDEDTSIRISDIEMLTDHEKDQLLYEFNDTEVGYPGDKTIHELFEEQARRKPNHTALAYQDNQLTYSLLNERSNQLAFVLREKGIQSNSIVGIILDHSLEMILGILGILKSGGAYFPIDPEFPEERIKYMTDDSNVEIILTDKNRVNKILPGDLKESKNHQLFPHICKKREQIKEFDKMPIPDRSLVDNEKYNQYIGQVMAKHCITIQATRGCPYKCAYCHKIWPKTHVVRSAENIFSEVLVYYKMGFRRFAFIDDIFNLDRNNSRRFFELIIKNKIHIQIFFPNGMRGDILTKEYIDLMVEAGVVNIAIALETASPRLQKLIEKNINLAKLRENVEYINKKYPHVITEFFTMHGFPTETKEEATMTLDFIKSMKWVHFPYIFLLNIYPNTDMEKLALKSGISKRAILNSNKQAFHQLPQTLPFEETFTQEIQSDFLQNYFLKKERLLFVLPYQMKILSEDELIQKYNSYLPVENRTFEDFLHFVNIQREELSTKSGIDETSFIVPEVNHKMEKFFGKKPMEPNALRILLLDLSQSFSEESHLLNYLIAPPLGLMYLLTYLQQEFGNKVVGKIAKPIIDFDNYKELKQLLNEFKPDVIGIRTLTFYKDFFHRIVDIIRRFGYRGPIIGGGPYATSDYTSFLQDENVDVVVLGEGEITFAELIKEILKNNKELPDDEILKGIDGISFIPNRKQYRSQLSKEVILLDEFQEDYTVKSEGNLINMTRPCDLAYAIYTSGTVGRPKGTLITHSSLNNLCFWHNREYTVTSRDHATKYAGFGFDASVWEIFPYMIKGARINIIDEGVKLDVYRLNEYFERHDITISYLPTQICHHFMSMPNRSLRILLTGGDKLSRFESRNYQLVNNYGPTENAVVTTCFNVDTQWDNIPIGSPVDNVRLYILGQNHQLQVAGTPGELCIGGNSLSIGYLNCLEETVERFIDNPYEVGEKIYCTGDLVRWLRDGNIEFLGRKDDQVKIRGFRIELGEIESQLLTHRLIENAVVLSRADDGGDKYLCAYIVIEQSQKDIFGEGESDNRAIESAEFRDYLSKRLPEYMVPSYFIQIEKLPLTANGKIDRKSLPDPKITFGNEYIAPRNEIEEQLVVIWSEILGIERQKIGINFNFFDLGGHSLKAVILISKIKETLNVNIPISNIFKEPTIENLSILINFAKNREESNINKEDREKIVL